jgi:hypothetical protein
MATPTPLTPPKAALQAGQFYPFTVTIKSLSGTTLAGPLACAYEAAKGGAPAMFEDEASAGHKIMLATWQPGIAAKSQAVLNIQGTKRKFEVLIAVPQGDPPNRTLLIASPI